jgi:hypothetical protein
LQAWIEGGGARVVLRRWVDDVTGGKSRGGYLKKKEKQQFEGILLR